MYNKGNDLDQKQMILFVGVSSPYNLSHNIEDESVKLHRASAHLNEVLIDRPAEILVRINWKPLQIQKKYPSQQMHYKNKGLAYSCWPQITAHGRTTIDTFFLRRGKGGVQIYKASQGTIKK